MNKNTKKKTRKSAAAAGKYGESNLQSSPLGKMTGKVKSSFLTILSVVLFSLTSINENAKGKAPKKNTKPATKAVKRSKRNGKVSTQKVKTEKVEKLTEKQIQKIQSATIKRREQLAALPPPPYTKISPAPKISGLNPKQLCVYCANIFPRLVVVPEFATSVPTVTFVQGIYDALFPLAIKDSRKLGTDERALLETYDTQLRENFMNMIVSIATLCNGNKNLFSLSGVATKKTPEKHNGKPPTPVFKFLYNKGTGVLGIKIDKIEFVKSFTVYFGKAGTDPSTWAQQNGNTRQLITGFAAGETVGVRVIANGSKQSSSPSNVQTAVVPFN